MEAVRRFSASKLRDWRMRRGLSHDALTAAVGVARPNLIAYEKGRRRPSPATVRALAAALEIYPGDLAGIPRGRWTLEDLRAFSGWTKADVASALGIARSTYDAMESGRRTLRADLVDKLAAVIGCDPAEVRSAAARSPEPR